MLPISPKVGGFVAEVRIVDNQRVKAGDTLVVLDDRDFRARLAQTDADYAALLATVSSRSRVGQAEALVRQAEATARKAHADLERLLPLAQQDIVSKQQLDAAQTAVAAADAQLAAAQAALVGADARVAAARAARDLAALQLSYTRVTAPMAGVVSKKSVEAGQLVQQGQPLMSLVSLDDAWVVANLKETPWTSPWTPTLGGISAGAWRASRPPQGPSSRCSRPTTPPATSPRWCSASRCGSGPAVRWTRRTRCGLG